MIDIKLADGWRLTADENQWIIQKGGKIAKDGRPRWEGVTYHPTVEAAITSFARERLRGTDADSMATLLEKADVIAISLVRAYQTAKEVDSVTNFGDDQ